MSDVVIRVENLSKQYRLGTIGSGTLRDDVDRMWARVRGKPDPLAKVGQRAKSEERGARSGERGAEPATDSNLIWALRDVSFDVKQGEVVGIIGRNGAGKSTLLKILSRITAPTSGVVKIKGRIASLLEVGTGFHPELTGRENIYLNGAILGMKRAEIAKKFDEIVAFAEVEQFIDTPVKRYSSGMYVRLAFAVAAHLEPEILVVDEVLAVGDAAFQKKCLGKMGDVAKEGRTVLFVSHNMAAILSLCPRSILLINGGIDFVGLSTIVIPRYLQSVNQIAGNSLENRSDRTGNQILRFSEFAIMDTTGTALQQISTGQDVWLNFSYRAQGKQKNVRIDIGMHGRVDETLFHLSTDTKGTNFSEVPERGKISCFVPRFPLAPGVYTFNLYCTVNGDVTDWIQNAGTIEVSAGDFFRSGKLPATDQGSFLVEHTWKITNAL